MSQTGPPSVRWLTTTACAAFLVYASTPTLLSVSLKAISADLGIGYGAQGTLVLARAAVLGAVTLAAGHLADRLGKRYVLTGAMLLVMAGMLWVGRSGGLAGLVGGIAVMSGGLGGLEALNGALISDLHPRAVASRVNFVYAFYPCGVVVSSLAVGAALDAGVDWRVPFAFVAVPCALVAGMYWVGSYPAAPTPAGGRRLTVRGILANRTFWLLLCAMLLTAGAMGCILYWGPSFIQESYGASAKAGSAGLAAFMAAMAAGRFGMGAATRSMPLLRIMLAMVVLGVVCMLSLLLVNDFRVSMAALVLAGIAFSCFWPGMLALAVSRIGAGSTTLLAMVSSAGIVGFGLVPCAVGQVAGGWGLRAALGVCPVAIAVTGALLVGVSVTGAPRLEAGTVAEH